MKYNGYYTFGAMTESAQQRFSQTQQRLGEVEKSFEGRMNGKSLGQIAATLVLSLLWLVVFVTLFALAKKYTYSHLYFTLQPYVIGVMALLLLLMMIDDIISISYYGRISSYRSAVLQMRNRIESAEQQRESDRSVFMAAHKQGWNMPLSIGSSVHREATGIESTMAGMESLKRGFLHKAKNIAYFAFAIVFCVVGSVALFDFGTRLVGSISDGGVSYDTMQVLNVIALIIVLVGEILLAKLAWSRTDCAVTNKTLWAVLAGPVAYLALLFVGTILVVLVVALLKLVVQIIGYVIGIVIAGALLFGLSSGG